MGDVSPTGVWGIIPQGDVSPKMYVFLYIYTFDVFMFSRFASQIFRKGGGVNTNSISYINSQSENVTLDPSGTDYIDYSNNAAYFHDAHGINPNDENSTSLVVQKNDSPFFLSSLAEFTWVFKYKLNSINTTSIVDQFFNNTNYDVSFSNTSLFVGETLDVHVLKASHDSITYTISGDLTSADLSNADLTGTISATETTLSYPIVSGNGQFRFLLDNTDISNNATILLKYWVKTVTNWAGDVVFAFASSPSGTYYDQPDLSFNTGDVVYFDVSNTSGYNLVFGTVVDSNSTLVTSNYSETNNVITLDLTGYGSTVYYFEDSSANMGYVDAPTTIVSASDYNNSSQINYSNVTKSSYNSGQVWTASWTQNTISAPYSFANGSYNIQHIWTTGNTAVGTAEILLNPSNTSLGVYANTYNSDGTAINSVGHAYKIITNIGSDEYLGYWLQITMPYKFLLKNVFIKAQNILRSPKKVFFLGSNDNGTTFTYLTEETFPELAEHTTSLSNISTAYYTIRMVMNSTNGENTIYLYRWQLIGDVVEELPPPKVVTVANGVFVIDGVSKPEITFTNGETYIFDQSDSTNAGFPIVFGTSPESSSLYTTGVTVVGTPGQAGAYTKLVYTGTTGALYYYSTGGSLMGYFNGYAVKTVQNWTGQDVFSIKSPDESDYIVQPDLSFNAGETALFYVGDSSMTGYSLVFGTVVDDNTTLVTSNYSQTDNVITLDLTGYSETAVYYFEDSSANMGYVDTTTTSTYNVLFKDIYPTELSHPDEPRTIMFLSSNNITTKEYFGRGGYKYNRLTGSLLKNLSYYEYVDGGVTYHALIRITVGEALVKTLTLNDFYYRGSVQLRIGINTVNDVMYEITSKETLSGSLTNNFTNLFTANTTYTSTKYNDLTDTTGTSSTECELYNNTITFSTPTPIRCIYITTVDYGNMWLSYNGDTRGIAVTGVSVLPSYQVTVANGVFVIDGVSKDNITFTNGETYVFDQSDPSNAGFPIVFGTSPESSSLYTTGVTVVGTPGQAGAYTRIDYTGTTGALYYYNNIIPGMGYAPNTISYNVTVADTPPKFYLNSVPQVVTFTANTKYYFYQYDTTNAGYPIVFDETADDAAPYFTDGVTTVGTPGQAGAYTILDLSAGFTGPLVYFSSEAPDMGFSEVYTVKVVQNWAGNNVFSIQAPGEDLFYDQPDLSFNAGDNAFFDVGDSSMTGYTLVFGTEIDNADTILSSPYVSQSGTLIQLNLPSDYTGGAVYYFENTNAGMGYVEATVTTTTITTPHTNINPPNSSRYHSSVYTGTTDDSTYDSTYSWIADVNSASKLGTANAVYMTIDCGSEIGIVGLRIQGRPSYPNHYVAKLTVEYSSDGTTYNDVDNGAEFDSTATLGNADFNFATPVLARYIKITPTAIQESNGFIAMRAGLIEGAVTTSTTTTITTPHTNIDPHNTNRTYSDYYPGGGPDGANLNDSTISNATLCWALSPTGKSNIDSGTPNSYMTIDCGSEIGIVGFRLRPRGTYGQYVKAVTIDYSSDGSTYSNVDNGALFDSSITATPGNIDFTFTTPVLARYIKIWPQSYNSFPSMNAGLIQGTITTTITDSYTVTVSNEVFFIDTGSGAQSKPQITFTDGESYVFDQSDESNAGYPILFGTTIDDTSNLYNTGVTVVGTPGQPGAYTRLDYTGSTALYYFSSGATSMGYGSFADVTDQLSYHTDSTTNNISGSSLTNLVNSSLNGTIKGTLTYETNIGGRPCYLVPKTGAAISLPASLPTNSCTFSAYFYRTSATIGSWTRLVGFHTTSVYHSVQTGLNSIGAGTTEKIVVYNASGSPNMYTGNPIAIYDEWIHFCITYDNNGSSSSGNIYINGVKETTYSNSTLDIQQYIIGGYGNLSNPQTYGGFYLNDVRVYDKILSDSEVSSLYGYISQ